MSFAAYLGNCSDDVVVVALFALTIIGHLSSWLWERFIVPRLFFSEETRLVREIFRLEREADDLNRMATMPLYSKVRRKVLVLRKRLGELRKERYAYTVDVNAMLTSPLWLERAPVKPSTAPTQAAPGAPPQLRKGTAALQAASAARVGQGDECHADLSGQNESRAAFDESNAAPAASQAAAAAASAAATVPPRGVAWLLDCGRRYGRDGWRYVRCNLPDVVRWALRGNAVCLAWLLWGQRAACVRFPSCLATHLPSAARALVAKVTSFVLFGLMVFDQPAAERIQQDRQPVTAAASTDPSEGKPPPRCSAVVWALLCLVSIRYVIRILS